LAESGLRARAKRAAVRATFGAKSARWQPELPRKIYSSPEFKARGATHI
jgi:hypothetical protein